jgi:hypothetical protein
MLWQQLSPDSRIRGRADADDTSRCSHAHRDFVRTALVADSGSAAGSGQHSAAASSLPSATGRAQAQLHQQQQYRPVGATVGGCGGDAILGAGCPGEHAAMACSSLAVQRQQEVVAVINSKPRTRLECGMRDCCGFPLPSFARHARRVCCRFATRTTALLAGIEKTRTISHSSTHL